MGEVIADPCLPRDGYFVSSKVFFGASRKPRPTRKELSRKHISQACHEAPRRLRVDHLDLGFCHRPDVQTPIEEMVWAMDRLIRQGEVLYWRLGMAGGVDPRSASDRARSLPACAGHEAAAVQPAAARAR